MSTVVANLVDTLITAAITGGDDALEAAIIAEFPILANPFLKYFLDQIVSGISAPIDSSFINFANQIVVDFQINGEKSDVFNAAQLYQSAQSSSNPNQLQAATTGLLNAYRNLINGVDGDKS